MDSCRTWAVGSNSMLNPNFEQSRSSSDNTSTVRLLSRDINPIPDGPAENLPCWDQMGLPFMSCFRSARLLDASGWAAHPLAEREPLFTQAS
ncbi:hypothetical protein PGTUg99_010479 [Puccinia graminis f. sp. tritici]|uniref:Uncharacterized protein n=1 Tax=Puccinia graminis f. sp. tritici TaxID=56615 RepID=A0A5B0R0Z0_PUCGR|nr:hypothetical protein PGTUg99_010479 [Puccinia graminis f. sp. tritici]